MNRMRAAPEIVRRQRQDADRAADPVVRAPVREERPMTAVVLNHEKPDQKRRGGERDEQRHPPVAEREGEPGRGPKRDKREQRDRQFGDAAHVAWPAVAAQQLPEMPCISRHGLRIVSNAQADVPDRLLAAAGLRARGFFCAAVSAATFASAASFSSRRARSRSVFASTRAFSAAYSRTACKASLSRFAFLAAAASLCSRLFVEVIGGPIGLRDSAPFILHYTAADKNNPAPIGRGTQATQPCRYIRGQSEKWLFASPVRRLAGFRQP